MRRPRERVRLPAPGLTVAERRGGEAVDGHLDEPLDARVLQDVALARLGLEDHVEGERLELVHLLLLDLREKSCTMHIKLVSLVVAQRGLCAVM